MSKQTEKAADQILRILRDTDGINKGEVVQEIDRQGLFLGEGEWIQLEDGTRRICGARYAKLERDEEVIRNIEALAKDGRFRISFDKNYGVERITGWSVSVDGRWRVGFVESLEVAIDQALDVMSDAIESGKTKPVSLAQGGNIFPKDTEEESRKS